MAVGKKLVSNRTNGRMSSGKFGTAANRKAERGSLTKSINKIRKKNAMTKVKNMLDGGTSFTKTEKGRAKITRTLVKTATRIGRGRPNG